VKSVHKRQIIEIAETNLSDASKISYENNLKLFFEFSEIKNTKQLIHLPSDQLQDILIDYTRYVNTLARAGKISNNTVPKRFKGIKYVLDINYRENDVKWKVLKALFPERVRHTGYKPYTTEQIQDLLKHQKSHRNKAFIHFMSSLGARIGIHAHPLLIKHLVPMKYLIDDDCFAVLLYADKNLTPAEKDQKTILSENDDYAYYGFLTPEATKALKSYFQLREREGEILDANSPVFRTFAQGKYNVGVKVNQLSRRGAISLMFRLVADVDREKVGNRYNIQMDHGFRKRFNTILKLEFSVNANIAEKLLDHKRGLDGTYLTPTRDQCFHEFVKAIPQLTISSEERLKAENAKSRLRIDELERRNERIVELEAKVGRMGEQMFAMFEKHEPESLSPA